MHQQQLLTKSLLMLNMHQTIVKQLYRLLVLVVKWNLQKTNVMITAALAQVALVLVVHVATHLAQAALVHLVARTVHPLGMALDVRATHVTNKTGNVITVATLLVTSVQELHNGAFGSKVVYLLIRFFCHRPEGR